MRQLTALGFMCSGCKGNKANSQNISKLFEWSIKTAAQYEQSWTKSLRLKPNKWRLYTKFIRRYLVNISFQWMRSCLVVRASGGQCKRCNGAGFKFSIRRHNGIWGAADEAALKTVHEIFEEEKTKISLLIFLCFLFSGRVWQIF